MTRLERLDRDLWHAEDALRLPGGVVFPVRMVVARLPDGGLWLHSPIEIDRELAAELASLGPVRYLVAPNRLHHLFLQDAMMRYPDAAAIAAPGLVTKRSDLADRLTALEVVDDAGGLAMPAAWGDAFDGLLLGGNRWIGECVFLHRATGTLVCTDLLFCVHAPANVLSRLVFWCVGALGKPGQSPAWRLTTTDRTTQRRAVERLLTWPFERVVMAHGTPLEADGRAVIAGVFRWLRPQLAVAAQPRLGPAS